MAFLVERTGERIECLLNPQTFTVTRQAGLRSQRTLAGPVTGRGDADETLLPTGGGVTELTLELLFDMTKAPQAGPDASVQTLTSPLWALAENSDADAGGPPQVLFCWGKAWNIPAIVVAAAERFEQFTPAGVPRRSWMTLRLRRRAEPPPADTTPADPPADLVPPDPAEVPADALQVHEVGGESPQGDDRAGRVERLDELAHRLYGDASMWRVIAAFNGIDDPARVPPGTQLSIPPLAA